jgi:hypothetical protein
VVLYFDLSRFFGWENFVRHWIPCECLDDEILLGIQTWMKSEVSGRSGRQQHCCGLNHDGFHSRTLPPTRDLPLRREIDVVGLVGIFILFFSFNFLFSVGFEA